MTELEQLRKLVFEGGWDAESKEEVRQYERRLHEISVKEKLAEEPVFKEWIDWLKNRVVQAELLLKSDRKLSDRERDALFERIDACENFLAIFNGATRLSVEAEIKESLAEAISKSS